MGKSSMNGFNALQNVILLIFNKITIYFLRKKKITEEISVTHHLLFTKLYEGDHNQ